MMEEIKEITCCECGDVHEVSVNVQDYVRWLEGEVIQYVMPYLSDDSRELLISRTCGQCFDAMFDREAR